MDPKLLSLPLVVQIALGSGYAAYCVGYMGIRQHHKPVDVTFTTLAFSVITTMMLAVSARFGPFWSPLFAVLVTLFAAVCWRKYGRGWLKYILRVGDISWTDDCPSALATLSQGTNHTVSQIAVLLDDGTWLECRDTGKFAQSPFGPCIIGENGDIGLYLTDKELPDGTSKVMKTTQSSIWGDRITYVPAGRIREITLRHNRRVSRPWRAAGTRVPSSSVPSVEPNPSLPVDKQTS